MDKSKLLDLAIAVEEEEEELKFEDWDEKELDNVAREAENADLSSEEPVNEKQLATTPMVFGKKDGQCKCNLRWIDQACILNTIKFWTPKFDVICSGCFWLRDSQRDHECLGFISDRWIAESMDSINKFFVERTNECLRDGDTLEEMFDIYLQTHADSGHLEKNFERGVLHLLNAEMEQLTKILWDKDVCAGYKQEI